MCYLQVTLRNLPYSTSTLSNIYYQECVSLRRLINQLHIYEDEFYQHASY